MSHNRARSFRDAPRSGWPARRIRTCRLVRSRQLPRTRDGPGARRTQRKPMSARAKQASAKFPGASPDRLDDRHFDGLELHAPPRSVRFGPPFALPELFRGASGRSADRKRPGTIRPRFRTCRTGPTGLAFWLQPGAFFRTSCPETTHSLPAGWRRSRTNIPRRPPPGTHTPIPPPSAAGSRSR